MARTCPAFMDRGKGTYARVFFCFWFGVFLSGMDMGIGGSSFRICGLGIHMVK